MISSEQILERAAQDGSIDMHVNSYSVYTLKTDGAEWPRVLESLLQRLHDIVYNEFPLPLPLPQLPLPTPLPPPIDPEVVASTPPTHEATEDLPDADTHDDLPPNSQSSSKENDIPPEQPAPAVQPPEAQPPPGTLPPDILSIYTHATHLLQTDFSQSPPYTLQRLAELVLYPRQHYRFLPPFLRALDRIISVSSPVTDFPLPSLNTSANGGNGFLTNGDSSNTSTADGLGSDESLGGALLTPIPWLRNPTVAGPANQNDNGNDAEFRSEHTETIEGPNGAGSIETVSVTVNGISSHPSPSHPASPTLSEQSDASTASSAGSASESQMRELGAVTQGELLRQEQEAGVIPITNHAVPRRDLAAAGAVAVGRETATEPAIAVGMELGGGGDDVPHARGPEEIGMEDVGLQRSSGEAGLLDMEAAVGRGRSKSPQPPPMVKEEEGRDPGDVIKEEEMKLEEEVEKKEAAVKDEDGDVVVADADGFTRDERPKGETTDD